jgi:hypothetical protein
MYTVLCFYIEVAVIVLALKITWSKNIVVEEL